MATLLLNNVGSTCKTQGLVLLMNIVGWGWVAGVLAVMPVCSRLHGTCVYKFGALTALANTQGTIVLNPEGILWTSVVEPISISYPPTSDLDIILAAFLKILSGFFRLQVCIHLCSRVSRALRD